METKAKVVQAEAVQQSQSSLEQHTALLESWLLGSVDSSQASHSAQPHHVSLSLQHLRH